MADDDARKLFVAGLSDSIDEGVLRDLFTGIGATSVEVNIPRDRATGRPRGFAFVTLGTADEASKARTELDGSLQAGRSIAVRAFRSEGRPEGGREGGPREERGGDGHGHGGGGGHGHGGGGGHGNEERTLYVRNLPYESTREEVAELFKSMGVNDIDRVHLPVGPDGRGKGFGFVTLRNATAAQAAIPMLHNASLRGRTIVANIARAREDRERDRAMMPSGGPMPGGGMGFPRGDFARGDAAFPPRGGDGRRDPRRFEGRGGSDSEEGAAANKNKKGKRRGAATNERDRRRRDEGLRSPRGRAEIDDWDED